MIDVSSFQGRVLAQFMYSELEKIARVAKNTQGLFTFLGETLPQITQAGIDAQKTLRAQSGAFSAGAKAPRLRDVPGAMLRQRSRTASLEENVQKQIDKLDGLSEQAKKQLRSLDPKEQAEAREALRQIEQSRRDILGSKKPAPKPPAPKPPAPAPKKTIGQQFDRLANLTGKGVLTAGGLAGAAALYDASKPQNPYSNYA